MSSSNMEGGWLGEYPSKQALIPVLRTSLVHNDEQTVKATLDNLTAYIRRGYRLCEDLVPFVTQSQQSEAPKPSSDMPGFFTTRISRDPDIQRGVSDKFIQHIRTHVDELYEQTKMCLQTKSDGDEDATSSDNNPDDDLPPTPAPLKGPRSGSGTEALSLPVTTDELLDRPSIEEGLNTSASTLSEA